MGRGPWASKRLMMPLARDARGQEGQGGVFPKCRVWRGCDDRQDRGHRPEGRMLIELRRLWEGACGRRVGPSRQK